MSSKQYRAVSFAAIMWILATGSALGQNIRRGQPPSVAAMTAAFERSVEAGRGPLIDRDAGWIPAILIEPHHYGQELVGPVLDALERLAIDSESVPVKTEAIGWLAAAGDTSSLGTGLKRQDVVERLKRVYAAVAGTAMATSLVERVAAQANRERALAFLEEVARSDRPEFGDMDFAPPYAAVFALARSGTRGRAILTNLHSDKAVRNSHARSYLDQIAQRAFIAK